MKYLALLAALLLGGCYYTVYRRESQRVPIEQTYPITRPEVEKMIGAGVSDAVIVEKAKSAGVVKLSADDIVALKQAGASDTLIQALLSYERR